MKQLKGLNKLSFYFLLMLGIFLCVYVVHAGLAPDFTLTDVDGHTFSLSGFRGKIVLIEFFTTYCGVCRDYEIPQLKTVRNAFGSKLVTISLTADPWHDTDELLRQFRSNYSITWILARDTADVYHTYQQATGNGNGVPAIYTVDQNGNLRYYHVGETAASVLIAEINALIPHTCYLTVQTSPSLSDIHFKVDGADYYTSGGSFSVELNTGQHQVQLADTTVAESDDIQYRFSRWSGIGSGSASQLQIEIAASSTLEADFERYCKVVFTQSGSEGTPHVTVDGASYVLPQAFWFVSGSSHGFTYEPVDSGAGTRCAPRSASCASPLTVEGPATVVGNYETQYCVTVSSEHGDPTQSQWVDRGGSLSTSVTSPADGNGEGTRYRCVGSRINDGSLQQGTSYTFENVQGPQKIDFQWICQYSLVSSSAHGVPDPMGTTWYDSGTSVSATVPGFADDDGAGTRHRCTGWTGAGSVLSAGAGASTVFSITSPSSITWNWVPQHRITFKLSGLQMGSSVAITVDGNPHSGTFPLSCSEWFDKDSSVRFSVASVVDGETLGKRYAFVDWKNSEGATVHSSQKVSGSETFTACYEVQYCLTLNTSPGDCPQPECSLSGPWFDSGAVVTCAAQATDRYSFDRWVLDGAPQEAGNVQLIVTMDTPHTATAYYTAVGDLNLDGKVDEADLSRMADAFHSRIGDGNYDQSMDFDDDGVIGIRDVTVVAKCFEKSQ